MACIHVVDTTMPHPGGVLEGCIRGCLRPSTRRVSCQGAAQGGAGGGIPPRLHQTHRCASTGTHPCGGFQTTLLPARRSTCRQALPPSYYARCRYTQVSSPRLNTCCISVCCCHCTCIASAPPFIKGTQLRCGTVHEIDHQACIGLAQRLICFCNLLQAS